MNYNEKKNILGNFPNIELSYEKNLHNKVRNIDCYLTIPYGKKFFAWFYKYKSNNILFILEINKKNNHIKSIFPTFCCFKSNLCIHKGTIFYGTIFKYNDIRYFNIEDIFYYKKEDVNNYTNLDKFELEYYILKNEIKQIIYNKNDIIFGLPNISYNKNQIQNTINDLPYKVYSLQHFFLTKKINIFYKKKIKNQNIKRFAIFIVEATIEPDIYKLYYKENNKKYFTHCLMYPLLK